MIPLRFSSGTLPQVILAEVESKAFALALEGEAVGTKQRTEVTYLKLEKL